MRDAQAQVNPGHDTWGIMTSLQQGKENTGCRVLDCEVYNHVDQLGATVSSKPGTPFSEIRYCIIDGNDLYNTPEYIATPDSMENLLDYKIGSDVPAVNVITNNRFWGLAESGGGSGGLVRPRSRRCWS